MKNKKPTITDKSLANAVKKGEISLNNLSKDKKLKIKNIIKTSDDNELENASKQKYKFSKRKVKHISKNKNESMENNEKDFKKIITNIEDWNDKIKGGLAKNKKPSDYDLDKLSKGAEIQMEHTDDPEEAIDIAMDHLEEFDDYYDDEIGLPAMERDLKKRFDDEYDFDDDEDDFDEDDDDDDFDDDDDNDDDLDELTSDDDEFDEDDDISESNFIKNFSSFSKINEQNQPNEPKMFPRENKFKRTIEYSEEIEESLIKHDFIKNEGIGDFIVFDIMEKTFELVTEQPDDIRPISLPEFDHIMDNL